jgi:hypothetical protein
LYEISLVTGDDETEGASPNKKAKGKQGRKAGQKTKNNNQEIENETGNHYNSSRINISFDLFRYR